MFLCVGLVANAYGTNGKIDGFNLEIANIELHQPLEICKLNLHLPSGGGRVKLLTI